MEQALKMLTKNLNSAENQRTFLDGSKRTAVILESITLGRGEYLPGWQWSKHVGSQTGKSSETHVGYVLSGQMIIKEASGEETLIGPGDAFEAKPGHDAWVVGSESCIALDFKYFDKEL